MEIRLEQGMRTEAHRGREPLQPSSPLLAWLRAGPRTEDDSQPPARLWGEVHSPAEEDPGAGGRQVTTEHKRGLGRFCEWLKAWGCLSWRASGQS